MRCNALPPRYAFWELGLNGISKALCGSHGFCQGAVPFSSISMIESVTSWRKSRLMSVVSSGIRTLLGSEVGFRNFLLESRTRQELAAKVENQLPIYMECQ